MLELFPEGGTVALGRLANLTVDCDGNAYRGFGVEPAHDPSKEGLNLLLDGGAFLTLT
jgi:hypothetical protein